jgi:ADP-sugar diphosphatase
MASERKPTFTLAEIQGHTLTPAIPVYLPPTLTEAEFHLLLPKSPSNKPAYTFPALLDWLTKLLANFAHQQDETHTYHKNPYKLRELDIQAVDWFWRNVPSKEDKLGFMKLQAKIETDPYVHTGEKTARADWLAGAVFLRGGSVAILVCLSVFAPWAELIIPQIIVQPADTNDEQHVILTVQPRIAASSLAFTEIPAGMLDASSFRGTAANEIAEEASLTVKQSELINMSELALSNEQERVETAIYPSPGACDEFIPLFLCQKRLTRRHMEWLKGKATGLRDEGENITLKLVPLQNAWREVARDGKALAALALYDGLKREGKLLDMPEEVEDEPEEVKCS